MTEHEKTLFTKLDELSNLEIVESGDDVPFRPVDQFIGKTVTNFKIVELIGRGAMGSVYKARHVLLDKDVAIKILHPHLCSNDSALKRFKQEAQSAVRLEHPGIVRVQDFGVTAEGQPYLLMDYVEGISLSQLVAAGPMQPDQAFKICAQICDALEEAHRKGVVHRDIKPSNVIIVNAGTAQEAIKVVDFGIAKVVEDSKNVALTQTGESIGSPPYMSPEQCQAQPLDPRSDIYSLGCVLYELLTGTSPFVGGSIYETICQHLHSLPESVGKRRPGIKNAVALDAVLLQALAKDPDKRFGSAAEFKKALSDTGSFSPQASLKARVNSFARVFNARYGWKPVVAGAAILILAAVPGYMAYQSTQGYHKKPYAFTPFVAPGDFERVRREAEALMQQHDPGTAAQKYKEAMILGTGLGIENEALQECMAGRLACLEQLGQSNEADAQRADLKRAREFATMDRFTILSNARTIAALTAQYASKPNDPDLRRKLANAYCNQAWLSTSLGDEQNALEHAESALKLLKPHENKDDIESAVYAMSAKARAYSNRYQLSDAENVVDEMMTLAERSGPVTREMARAKSALGGLLFRTADCRKVDKTPQQREALRQNSLTAYRESEAIWRKLEGISSPWLADTLVDQAAPLRTQRWFDQAENVLKRSIKMNEEIRGAEDARTARAIYALAFENVYAAELQEDEKKKLAWMQSADTLMARSADIIRRGSGDASELLPAIHALQGRIRQVNRDYAAAEDLFNRAFEESRRLNKDSDTAKYAYEHLIEIYTEQGRKKDIEGLMYRVRSDS
jgi:tRNA A-37 threonylcarbamoyl transferase component Bud32